MSHFGFNLHHQKYTTRRSTTTWFRVISMSRNDTNTTARIRGRCNAAACFFERHFQFVAEYELCAHDGEHQTTTPLKKKNGFEFIVCHIKKKRRTKMGWEGVRGEWEIQSIRCREGKAFSCTPVVNQMQFNGDGHAKTEWNACYVASRARRGLRPAWASSVRRLMLPLPLCNTSSDASRSIAHVVLAECVWVCARARLCVWLSVFSFSKLIYLRLHSSMCSLCDKYNLMQRMTAGVSYWLLWFQKWFRNI